MAKSNKKTYIENPEHLNRLVIGTKITGDIVTKSSFRLDGKIIGNIECEGRLILGKEGLIEGNVKVTEAEINGEIEGNITSLNLLTLSKTAIIKGNIQSTRLIIEDGALVSGKIHIGEGEAPFDSKKEKVKSESSDVVY